MGEGVQVAKIQAKEIKITIWQTCLPLMTKKRNIRHKKEELNTKKRNIFN